MRHIETIILSVFFTFLLYGCSEGAIEALPYQTGKDGGWGLMATDGTVCIPAGTFTDRPSAAVNGMFSLPVSDNECMLFDASNPRQPVSQRRFARIGHFFDKEATIAQETEESPVIIINREGKTLNDIGVALHYDIVCVRNFREGRALFITRKGKYGFMDTEGQIAVPPIYDWAADFHEGRALTGNANERGEMSYQCITPSGAVALQIQSSPCLLDEAYSDGLLMYSHSATGRYGYMDYNGETAVYLPDTIRAAYRFRNGAAIVQAGKQMGLINRQGEWLIRPEYEEMALSGNDRISARTEGAWQLLDFAGNRIGTPFSHALRFYDTGYAVARRNDGTCSWVNKDGAAADGQRYASIIEDSLLTDKELQQQFVRRSRPDREETPQAEQPQPDNRPTPPAERVKERREPVASPSSTVLSGEEWKNIGKQNPFYAEAGKILSGKLPEEDAGNRKMILNYVEHLRTSYTTKDIDFLTQLFSENALIIVGKVIRNAPQTDGQFLPREKVEYNIKSKQAYLERLKTLFRLNKRIDLRFSDFKILKHPTRKGLYGVSLRQKYSSDLYSDDGYLFLLWDFRDETMPLIHVRTWQPAMLDDRTPLPEREIFSINHFNLQ